MHLEITTPPSTDQVSLAISPDGKKVVFVAASNGRPQLWLRSLDSGLVGPLRGTDGASFPFWAPDSRSVGFFANERVNRIDLDGSSPKALAPAVVAAGGSWNRDGVILFPLVPDSPIFRVGDAGGEATPLPGSVPGARTAERFPQFLPDGRHFLYYNARSRSVALGDLEGPERRSLFDADAAAVFAPPDQVLFVRQGTLFAQRFNPVRLELVGEPSSVAEGIAVDAVGVAAVSASAVGSVVYRTGSGNQPRRFMWFDRSGRQIGTVGEPDVANPLNPSLSPDGHRVAINRSVDGNADIWTLDLGRELLSRFTFDAVPEICPIWSPDGGRLLFSKPPKEGSPFALYQKPTAEAGVETVVLELPRPDVLISMDWSRDGRFILYRSRGVKTGWDIWALPMQGGGKAVQVAATAFDERTGQFSPDVRWIAIESNESGRYEIYVQPFGRMGAKSLVSNSGGAQVRWRADGRELFYVAPDGQLMSVPVRFSSDGQKIELETPTPLFVTRIGSTVQGGSAHGYVVAADGQRFLMNTLIEQTSSPITLILNRRGQ